MIREQPNHTIHINNANKQERKKKENKKTIDYLQLKLLMYESKRSIQFNSNQFQPTNCKGKN